MIHQRLILIAFGLIAIVSGPVQSAKYGQSTSSALDDLYDEATTTASIPNSSNSSKRKGSYSSYSSGNGNYYDYSSPVPLEYARIQTPYYNKHYSDPVPSYTRQERYIHPDYMSDPLPVAAASNSLIYMPPYAIADSSAEPYAAASQGGGHGHGHGHGHQSHGHGHHYSISAVNTDAIGLLGLLGLLGILQAVLLLLTTTTTTAAMGGGRKKRDLHEQEYLDEESRMSIETLIKLALPSLNVVAQARNGKISVNCTQREVCKTNFFLVDNLGAMGRVASYRMTNAIENMIHEFDPSQATTNSIKKAGHLGRSAHSTEACAKYYPICKDLEKDGVYSIPVLLPPSHPLYYDNEKAKMLQNK